MNGLREGLVYLYNEWSLVNLGLGLIIKSLNNRRSEVRFGLIILCIE